MTAVKMMNRFLIRNNNLILPSHKTEKMKMTRQEYIFYKWSDHRRLRNAAWRDVVPTPEHNNTNGPKQ